MELSPDGRHKLDVVTHAETLLDADALGSALGAPVELKDGRRAARIDSAALGHPLEFASPRKDLRNADQIVAVLRTERYRVEPVLWIELETRSPGLVRNDSFSSGHAEEREYPAWGEYLFPYENLLVFGTGELVRPARTISLHLGPRSGEGTVWIAEIRAERRARAEGPRLTEAGLLSEISPEAPDGAALLQRLKSRAKPKDIYHELPPALPGWSPAAADRICEHFINGYDVGRPIRWRANPNGDLEWMHAFNRTFWFLELLRAYRATREEKYVRKLDEFWLSWLRANPEAVGHNGGGDPAWETLSTACRIYGTWLYGWFNLLQDPIFRDSTRLEILKSFFGHAEHLLRYQGYLNNWLIVESRVLYCLGLLFPEFRRSELWLQEGSARLARELERQVFPDGADSELAPGYHMMAVRGFLEPYELAKLNGLSTPPLFEERLPRTFEYIAGMTRPDGTLPSVNDSGGYRKGRGEGFLETGARLFNRAELAAAPEGSYAGRSRAFADCGFHVLASGKAQRALWSLFDCGDVGRSHRHDDALSVEFFAFGCPFIVDPGITGYFPDRWTRYYRSTEAHNTVLVNGQGQNASATAAGHVLRSVRGKVERAFGEVADFVRARYGGYAGLPPEVTHTRAVLFVRGAYWVLFDEVTGPAQEIEARFQFVPLRLALDGRARLFRTMRQGLPNLEVLVVAPRSGRNLKLSIATGETDPVGGWVSDDEDLPAPQARVRLSSAPLRLITVIFPFADGVSPASRCGTSVGFRTVSAASGCVGAVSPRTQSSTPGTERRSRGTV